MLFVAETTTVKQHAKVSERAEADGPVPGGTG